MTQDIDTILKGLHCCSRTNPDCNNCPFTTKEVHCRELELDAANVIIKLQRKVAEQEEEIYKLTERLGMMYEQN